MNHAGVGVDQDKLKKRPQITKKSVEKYMVDKKNCVVFLKCMKL